jgi:predicted GH43/DUF377 family glycosyl hydrolase
MKHLLLFLSIFFVFIGCEKSNPSAVNVQTTSAGKVAFTFDKVNAPAAVKTLTTTLSRSGYTTIEKTLNIASDTSASILFEQIAIGTWKVKVDAKNESGQVLYTGQSEVVVLENSVSMVNLVLSAVSSGVGSVQINVSWGTTISGWYDYENNAVLTGSSNSFDSGGVGQPRVYKMNGKYYMYYLAIKGSMGTIGLATSLDGITWEKFGSNPVFTSGGESWDANSVSPGPIIKKDSSFVMYYQGYSSSTGQMNVGIATSKDGIVWARSPNNRITVDGNSVYHASEVIQKEGKYYLYYDGYDYATGYRAVFLATSLNGISWTKVQSQPVLKSSYSWEIGGITFSTIQYENGKYTTVYSDNGYTTSNFGIATSTDGVVWSKESTPVFSQRKTFKQWANAGISYPFFTTVGNQKRIYYVGAVGTSYERRIGFAYFK